MNTYYLYKEDNNFTFFNDSNIKKNIKTFIKWNRYCILQFLDDIDDGTISYFVIKYGEYIIPNTSLFIDRKPKMFIDYIPDKKLVNGKYVDT